MQKCNTSEEICQVWSHIKSESPSGNRKHGLMKTWSEEMWKHYSSDQNSRL